LTLEKKYVIEKAHSKTHVLTEKQKFEGKSIASFECLSENLATNAQETNEGPYSDLTQLQ
jgi:hypothetical protein